MAAFSRLSAHGNGLCPRVLAGAFKRARRVAIDLRLVLAPGEIKALHIGENNVCRLG